MLANVSEHLARRGLPYAMRRHAPAAAATDVARLLNVDPSRIAKTVALSVDGKPWLAVVPAPDDVNAERIAGVLGAKDVRLLDELRFDALFVGCDDGAEPPFGTLWNLPVIVDERLTYEGSLVLRSGTRDESIEVSVGDFLELEQPNVASIATTRGLLAELPPVVEPAGARE